MGALTNKTNTYKSRPWELISIINPNIWDYYGKYIDCQVRGKNFLRILPYIKNAEIESNFINNKIRFNLINSLKINRLKSNEILANISLLFNLKNNLTEIEEKGFFFKPVDNKKFFHVLFSEIIIKNFNKNIFYSSDFGHNVAQFKLEDFNLIYNRKIPLLNKINFSNCLLNNFDHDQNYLISKGLLKISPLLNLKIKKYKENIIIIPDKIERILNGKDKKYSHHLNKLKNICFILNPNYLNIRVNKLIKKIEKNFTNIKFIIFPTNTHELNLETDNIISIKKRQLNLFFNMDYKTQVNKDNLNVLFTLHKPISEFSHNWNFLFPISSVFESKKSEVYKKFDGENISTHPVISNKFISILDLFEILLLNFIIWSADKNLKKHQDDFKRLKIGQFFNLT